jgi:hypothetical protein
MQRVPFQFLVFFGGGLDVKRKLRRDSGLIRGSPRLLGFKASLTGVNTSKSIPLSSRTGDSRRRIHPAACTLSLRAFGALDEGQEPESAGSDA